jgi:hypothetical protein
MRHDQVPNDVVIGRQFETSRASFVTRVDRWLVRQFQQGPPGKKLLLEVIIEQDGFVKVQDVTLRPEPLG